MNARKAARRTRGNDGDARRRQALAEEYLTRAELGESAAGDDIERTVNVGIAALAGIGFADAICLRAVGEYSTSGNHADAVHLLRDIDAEAAKDLQVLVGMKTATQYGVAVISVEKATRAMRAVRALAERARRG